MTAPPVLATHIHRPTAHTCTALIGKNSSVEEVGVATGCVALAGGVEFGGVALAGDGCLVGDDPGVLYKGHINNYIETRADNSYWLADDGSCMIGADPSCCRGMVSGRLGGELATSTPSLLPPSSSAPPLLPPVDALLDRSPSNSSVGLSLSRLKLRPILTAFAIFLNDFDSELFFFFLSFTASPSSGEGLGPRELCGDPSLFDRFFFLKMLFLSNELTLSLSTAPEVLAPACKVPI